MIYDEDELKSRVFYGLKNLSSTGKCLNDDILESAICRAFNLEEVGKSNDYADGILNDIQVSIKTKKIDPKIRKRSLSTDFQSHEADFLTSVDIIQRRQKLDFNESSASAEKIGLATLQGFQKNIDLSLIKYSKSKSYEIVCVHGYSSRNAKIYLMSLYWQEYVPLDPTQIEWVKNPSNVEGYSIIDSKRTKVAKRMNNGEFQSTCFIEYKDLTKYKNSAYIVLPIPEMTFDKSQCLTEIKDLMRENNDTNLFTF